MALDPAGMGARAPTFFQKVVANTPGDSRLEMCIQCGTCGGSCPSGPDMDPHPHMVGGASRPRSHRIQAPNSGIGTGMSLLPLGPFWPAPYWRNLSRIQPSP